MNSKMMISCTKISQGPFEVFVSLRNGSILTPTEIKSNVQQLQLYFAVCDFLNRVAMWHQIFQQHVVHSKVTVDAPLS